jgi:phosphoglucosamine mutase
MVRGGRPASALTRQFDPVPQLLKNVRFAADQAPLDMLPVQSAIADAESALAGQGRLLIRKSGTEPLIRVMAECEDVTLLERTVDSVVDAVAQAVDSGSPAG